VVIRKFFVVYSIRITFIIVYYMKR